MKVFFIVPTLGRPTLMDALTSLVKQKSKDWRALVIGDGIPVHIQPHPRIFTASVPKVRHGRAAGGVRNEGIHLLLKESKLPKAEYIGFLDDDDVLTDDYVDLLTSYTAQDTPPDVVIFRMNEHECGIVPPPGEDAIMPNKVGISFAVNLRVFEEGHFFEPSATEDYYFLKKMERLKKSIVFASEITYLVRPKTKRRKVSLDR